MKLLTLLEPFNYMWDISDHYCCNILAYYFYSIDEKSKNYVSVVKEIGTAFFA